MDHIVASLLQTNDAPSPSDTARTRRLLEDASTLLAAVEDEFSVLSQKRKALLALIRDYETAISPIRFLPTDILQHVFLLTLPDDRNPAMSVGESPLLVSQVCSTWRQAALTAPRLWSRLHIPLIRSRESGPSSLKPSNSDYDQHVRKLNSIMSNRVKMVEQWLKRAGTTDLSISITETTVAPSGSQSSESSYRRFGRSQDYGPERQWAQHSVDIVNTLVKYARQLAVLDLGISPDRAKPILALPLSKIPRLWSLRFCHPEYHDVAFDQHAIVSSPLIRALRVAISAPLIDGSGVQWRNLTHLSVTIYVGGWDRNPKLLRGFLSICQNLVVLSVLISTERRGFRELARQSSRDRFLWSLDSIVLPRLTTLFWEDWSEASEYATLFQYLYLPSLYEVKWTFTHSQHPTFTSDGDVRNFAFADLLKQSGHNLTKMELKTAGRRSFDSLFRCLKFAPGIERLHVEIQEKRNHRGLPNSQYLAVAEVIPLWEVLSLPINGQSPTPTHALSLQQDALNILLPRLTFISCKCYAEDFIPTSAIRQFILSRRQGDPDLAPLDACKLQKIHISLQSHESWLCAAAQRHREDRGREFLEELMTKFEVDVEGLEMYIEWPYRAQSDPDNRAFSPLSGLEDEALPEPDTDFRKRDFPRAFGLFPQNSLDLCSDYGYASQYDT